MLLLSTLVGVNEFGFASHLFISVYFLRSGEGPAEHVLSWNTCRTDIYLDNKLA